MKTFFGCTFIDKMKLREVGIEYPIKLEYYKEMDKIGENIYEETAYGIEIVETEYLPDSVKVEKKCIRNITKDENEENRILEIFKENQVTVINFEEIISDLSSNKFLIRGE